MEVLRWGLDFAWARNELETRWRAPVILAAVVFAMAAATPNAPAVFGGRDHWVVVSRSGQILDRFGLIGSLRPEDLSVSADGSLYAFSAVNGNEGRLLFIADAQSKKVRRLASAVGFFAAPSFTSDGQWVVFAHQDAGGGAIGAHQPDRTAHLYKIKTDGTEMTLISNNRGCHTQSSSLSPKSIVVAHASCTGQMRIARVFADANGHTTEEILVDDGQLDGEPDLHPDGNQVLFVRRSPATIELRIKNLKSRKSVLVISKPLNGTEPMLPAWGTESETIYFQFEGFIYRHNLKTKRSEQLSKT